MRLHRVLTARRSMLHGSPVTSGRGMRRRAATRGVAGRSWSSATYLRTPVWRHRVLRRNPIVRSSDMVTGRRGGMRAAGTCTRRQLRAIGARCVPELVLRGRRRIVPATSCRKLCSRRPSRRTATAAVEADTIYTAVAGDSAAVHVVNNRAIDVSDGAVVVKRSMIPIPAVVAETGITEPVIDSSIESNRQAPIPFVPSIHTVAPAPISWRPERASKGRQHPRAGYPIIAVCAISPITWRPDISFAWANRLRVNRQERRSDGDGYEHAAKGCNGDCQQHQCNQHQPNSVCHFAHPNL
jgi:hypothetical protein